MQTSHTMIAEPEVAPQTTSQPAKRTRPPAYPNEVRERCKALFIQGVRPITIAEREGVNPTTLNTWAIRYHWSAIASQSRQVMNRLSEKAFRSSTDPLRDTLREEAEHNAKLLRSKPAKTITALANTPEREGRVSVLKRLVETVSMIDDWDSTKRSGLVLATALGHEPTVDIASVPVNDSNGGLTDAQQPAEPQQVVDSPQAQPVAPPIAPDQPAG